MPCCWPTCGSQPASTGCIATITHYVTPLAFILDWLLFEKRGVYQWGFLRAWILYPVAYFAYALIYGAIIHRATVSLL